MDELLSKLTSATQLHLVQFYGENPGTAVNGSMLTLHTGTRDHIVTAAVAQLILQDIMYDQGELYALNPQWQPAATELATAMQDADRACTLIYEVTHQEIT